MNKKNLKSLLESEGSIIAPGAYDSISAKMIERIGFPAVYMTGFGVSGSLIGKPDIGLITMKEMVEQAQNIASSVHIPLIADADNGYGNELNIARTVELYEKAGVEAIQIEDQVTPKKCGHMERKEIIPFEDAVKKIRAAVRAKGSENTLIIARTDARAVKGKEEALRRCLAFAEEGADLIFYEAPQSEEELSNIAKELKGIPLVANMVENGKTSLLSKEELNRLGYKLIIWPITALLSSVKSMELSLQELYEKGISQSSINKYTFNEYLEFIGFNEHNEKSDYLIKNN